MLTFVGKHLTEKELASSNRADQVSTVMICSEIIFTSQINLDLRVFHLPTALFLWGREMKNPENKAGLRETQIIHRQFQ